ncbi:MAG TPA: sensor domain-containing diguanylate cyclase [Planctomycetota bacterium]|nr:sensor domain-containing diguanylate cyclase [Planctomycetota bacterium]
MIQTFEILYVGRRREEVEDIVSHGAVVHEASSIYEAIAQLKRTGVGAAVVEFEELRPSAGRALAALRRAAGNRTVLVSMTTDEWDLVRPKGFLHQEEVLLRPFYPDELWRRVTRAVLPPPAKAVKSFGGNADRLAAIIDDAQRLNRFTSDLASLGEHIVAVVKARLRATRVSLFLRGEEPGVFTAVEAPGLDREVRENALLRLGEGVAGEAATKKAVTLVQEAGRDGAASERLYRQPSYMIAPLVDGHEVVGVICVTERLEEGPFGEEDRAYMEGFADLAGQIVANALQFRAADELATIDEGTQLFNKRHFRRVLPMEVVRAKRYKHDLTLAMIDVDHFKLYNDAMGHQAGDRALATIAGILRESFRKSDIIVRYGGEEFAVIMPETSRKEGNGVGFVDRARKSVEAAGLAFEDPTGLRRVLTISGGVATLPLQAQTGEELVEKADQALYRAKARGRNCIVGA